MFQRDYILRMIEMLAQLVAGILKMIKTGELHQASQSLNSAYNLAFQHEVLRLKKIPEEILIDTLLKELHYTTGHIEMLAELFYAEAELLRAEHNLNEGISYYRKSLSLYEYIDRDYRTYSQVRQERIASVKERLGEKKSASQ
jgi:hypothetical protein